MDISLDYWRNYLLKQLAKKYKITDITAIDLRDKDIGSHYIRGDLTKEKTWDNLYSKRGDFDIIVDMMCSGEYTHDGIAKYVHKVVKPGTKLYWVDSDMWDNKAVEKYNRNRIQSVKMQNLGYTGKDNPFMYKVYTFE
jgi:hypothetical protein